jgi:hypothetical protein
LLFKLCIELNIVSYHYKTSASEHPFNSFPENVACDESDEAVIYFVCGYIVRGLIKRMSCRPCWEVILQSEESPQFKFSPDIEDEDERKHALIQQVNRGGLVIPSDLIYVFCMHAFIFFQEIFDEGEVQQLILSFPKPRDVFVRAFLNRVQTDERTAGLVSVKCQNGHDILPVLKNAVTRFFNVMSKNFISKVNDTLHAERKRGAPSQSSQNRKISKLTSDK